ncbi:hypothetical protein AC623_19685 [Bacillus sp. FJAT-27231]|nr:hypothetical protein AC623_19685 [Bacillus sp. FJAT-27231]
MVRFRFLQYLLSSVVSPFCGARGKVYRKITQEIFLAGYYLKDCAFEYNFTHSRMKWKILWLLREAEESPDAKGEAKEAQLPPQGILCLERNGTSMLLQDIKQQSMPFSK